MKTKMIIAAAFIALTPGFALAMGCSGDHAKQASSCKAGTSWDAQTGTCTPDVNT